MRASINCFSLGEHFESLKLSAYKDSAGIWTIGMGTIVYPDGKKVKEGDTCSASQAQGWYMMDLVKAENKVRTWVQPQVLLSQLRQCQYDALVDLVYNVGYAKSVFVRVNNNPDDPTIWGAFLLYNKVDASKDGIDNDKDGIVDEEDEMKSILGLTRRRQAGAHLYFLGKLDFYENLK